MTVSYKQKLNPLTGDFNLVPIGNVEYMGLWDASAGTAPSASPTKGQYWITSVAGTYSSVSYEVGDWIIYNGTGWDKVDNTYAVSSVQGRTGNVVVINDTAASDTYSYSSNKVNLLLGSYAKANADSAGNEPASASAGDIFVDTTNEQAEIKGSSAWIKLVSSTNVKKIVKMTEAEYTALSTKDANTFYITTQS